MCYSIGYLRLRKKKLIIRHQAWKKRKREMVKLELALKK